MAGPNPCKAQEDAYSSAFEAWKKTQAELEWVNNPKNEEAAAKFGKDRREYKEWQDSCRKAADANSKAATKVSETYAALLKCQEKHAHDMNGKSGGGQTR
jgi:hypothetical protein